MIPRLTTVLVAGVALLAGCASLGYQSKTVAFDRNALLLSYADMKQDYGEAKALYGRYCTVPKPIVVELCKTAAEKNAALQARDQKFRARVLTDEWHLSQVDWQELLGDIPKLLGLATTIAGLAL